MGAHDYAARVLQEKGMQRRPGIGVKELVGWSRAPILQCEVARKGHVARFDVCVFVRRDGPIGRQNIASADGYLLGTLAEVKDAAEPFPASNTVLAIAAGLAV
jgi:hypothetical protein